MSAEDVRQVEKEQRKFEKKLVEIERLRARPADELDPNQLQKIANGVS